MASADARLPRLLQLLESDPANLALLADAAETALAEGEPRVARELLDRSAALAPLPAPLTGLAGIAAMQLREFDVAAQIFGQLQAANATDPSLRFNLAWARAMLKDFDGALGLLDPSTLQALPQAAMLRVQLLHDRGEFDEAVACAKAALARHPDHRGLLSVVSVLAMDVEDLALARDCASRAGELPDALATLGALALGDDRNGEALDYFERALHRNSDAPRAWVGKGLAKLLAGAPDAVGDIRRGAELFGDHVGSWIAAGWANVVSGDVAAGKACFETALGLDHNFSESHGALAVIAILEGRQDEAQRATQTALRLDARSFSGALAQALLLSAGGKADAAQALIARALHTPIDASGRTIAKSLARYGLAN